MHTYKTLLGPSEEILYKDRKSKFYAYAYPLNSEEEAKEIIDGLRKKHPNANHICYAWQLGAETIRYRANDDGEPNNSAGMPIYGQIQSFGLTNVLVAVVRIFGGTKLGVGGLIQAYKTAASMAIGNATVVERQLVEHFELTFPYTMLDVVMRTIKKHQLDIVSQKMELSCKMVVSVAKKDLEKTKGTLMGLHQVNVEKLA